MKAFFEGIQYLFVNILFAPLDFYVLWNFHLGLLNTINLVFMIICAVAMVYWVKQLKIFETMKKTKILQRTLSLNKFPNPKPWD
jgi:hypothetical protein